ncbi:MAG: hypothetical protein JWP58_2481 [Hymenobacter sp.]|nr:hypothetical protein [Hymenobacter sp.]
MCLPHDVINHFTQPQKSALTPRFFYALNPPPANLRISGKLDAPPTHAAIL